MSRIWDYLDTHAEADHPKDSWGSEPLSIADVKDILAVRDALADLLKHEHAEECQECGIGRSEAWQRARRLLPKE
jgi:hypothetical protein